MSIDYNRLKIGDRLVRTKHGILSRHHALYMGFWEGRHLIAENQLNYGVRYLTLHEFLSEGTFDRVEYNDYCDNSQAVIIDRVNKKINTKYDFFSYNCEHFVSEILHGVAESKQITNALALAIGVVFCGLILKSEK